MTTGLPGFKAFIAKFSFSIVTFLMASGVPLPARAADIHVDKYYIYLNGEIRSGDAEHLANLVAKEKSVLKLIVNSQGGDLVEAMRIKDLVGSLHIKVSVATGGYCVSACFFIFIEGYERYATAANNDGTLKSQESRDRSGGVVGIHRPYLKYPTGDVSGVKRQESVMRSVRDYLAVKGVSQHLIDEMMSRPSNDIYWLKKNDLESFGYLSPGDEEAVIARCGYKRADTRYDENWSRAKEDKLTDCTFDYWLEQYLPKQSEQLAKLRAGWRPWLKK